MSAHKYSEKSGAIQISRNKSVEKRPRKHYKITFGAQYGSNKAGAAYIK